MTEAAPGHMDEPTSDAPSAVDRRHFPGASRARFHTAGSADNPPSRAVCRVKQMINFDQIRPCRSRGDRQGRNPLPPPQTPCPSWSPSRDAGWSLATPP